MEYKQEDIVFKCTQKTDKMPVKLAKFHLCHSWLLWKNSILSTLNQPSLLVKLSLFMDCVCVRYMDAKICSGTSSFLTAADCSGSGQIWLNSSTHSETKESGSSVLAWGKCVIDWNKCGISLGVFGGPKIKCCLWLQRVWNSRKCVC